MVIVSAGSDRVGGAAARGAWLGAGAALEVASCEVTVAETEPLSPPLRIRLVAMTATNSTAPAMPPIHIQRRSMWDSSISSSSYPSSSW